MIGVRLEVQATIITGAKTSIHNLLRVVEKAGVKVSGLILMSLASGHLCLSKDEKAIGTVLVDIGAGQTTIAIIEQNNLVATSTLPIGGEYITSDISIGLRTQVDIAEKIKLKFGCAVIDDAAADQVFKVNRIGSNVDKEFSQVDLANIIEPRVQEIFHLIQLEVQRLGYTGLPGGYVLTGGTVSMPGVLAVAQAELATSVRIAVPDFIGVRDPSFTSGVGIIQYAYKYLRASRQSSSTVKKASANKKVTANSGNTSGSSEQKPSIMERFKNWLSEFI
jgi:cell division protein FtsA